VIAWPPGLFGEGIFKCETAEGKTVRLFALTPIYEDEMRFKLEHGAEALLEKMEARELTELFDPQRRSVLAKRFWLV
jgi:hypothetical protein